MGTFLKYLISRWLRDLVYHSFDFGAQVFNLAHQVFFSSVIGRSRIAMLLSLPTIYINTINIPLWRWATRVILFGYSFFYFWFHLWGLLFLFWLMQNSLEKCLAFILDLIWGFLDSTINLPFCLKLFVKESRTFNLNISTLWSFYFYICAILDLLLWLFLIGL